MDSTYKGLGQIGLQSALSRPVVAKVMTDYADQQPATDVGIPQGKTIIGAIERHIREIDENLQFLLKRLEPYMRPAAEIIGHNLSDKLKPLPQAAFVDTLQEYCNRLIIIRESLQDTLNRLEI